MKEGIEVERIPVSGQSGEEKKSKRESSDSLFPFDPNQLDRDGWMRLGLSRKEAEVLLNFRKKGGRFQKKEDLLKVFSVDQEDLDRWEPYIRFEEKEQLSNRDFTKKENREEELEPFPFDPNRLPMERWTELGLSQEQARVVENYRQSGGRFWEKADLLDLYVVDSSLYFELKPYVKIDREALRIPLEEAGPDELQKIPGIGRTIAGRIVKYRELLGGYVSVQQLDEVYGMPDSLLPVIEDRSIIRDTLVDPLSLNAEAEELMRHPYISPDLARAIVSHRKRYGSIEKKRELLELDLLDDNGYRKIAPYIQLPSNER